MYKGPVSIEKARRLRQDMTRAEQILWEALRDRKLAGLKFRRQKPVEGFVVDFCCVERSLVVELDGAYHQEENQQVYDKERTMILEAQGHKILRIQNRDLDDDLKAVLGRIKNEAESCEKKFKKT